MSRTKTIIFRALVAVSALFILSQQAASAWSVKVGDGHANAVAVDRDGNIIAAGSMLGPTLDVYKLSGRDGGVIWHYRYDYGIASRVIVDLNNDVIVGSERGPIIKIAGATGAELWVKAEFARVTDVKTDGAGNIFAAGHGNGVFKVVKLDARGEVIWRYLSRPGTKDNGVGLSYDIGYALDLTRDGDVVAAGMRDEDFAVIKISGQNGAEIGQQEIDGAGYFSYFFERAAAVAVGADGSVLAAGSTSNPSTGPSDFTVAKFSGDLGRMLWIHEIDGSAYTDAANALTLDAAGNVIAAGSLFKIYEDRWGHVIWSGDQFAVVKISGSTGEVLWKELADGEHDFPARGMGHSVTVNPEGDVFASGLYNDAFTVVRKSAETGKNVWRHLEVDALINGTGRQVTLDARHAVVAAGETTSADRQNQFTVIKLDPASGLDYAAAVPETVQKYAPMVYLHPDDKYRPGDPMTFISRSELRWSHQAAALTYPCDDHGAAGRGAIDAGRLGEASSLPYAHNPRDTASLRCLHLEEIKLAASDHTRPFDGSKRGNILGEIPGYMKEGFFLDPENSEDLRQGIKSITGSSFYPGAPVFYEYEKGVYVAYWFFYPYDEFTDILYSPTPLQFHEGDWERVSIQLDEDDNPGNISYYHHNKETVLPWGVIDKYETTHPVVYSAIGSHGSYPEAGSFGIDFLTSSDHTAPGPRWLTWQHLSPVKEEPWYGFGGAWGEVSSVINVPVPFFGDLSGDYYTGPLGPSKYKTSRDKWFFTLTGRVKGLYGEAITGAELILTDLQGNEIATVRTNDEGKYRFTVLALGRSYAVRPVARGLNFTPAARTFVDVRENQTADFEVLDTTPPVLHLPPDIIANADSPRGATVYYVVSATDDVTTRPRVACAPLSGALFPAGTTDAICEAVDDAGNRATGTFKVTVKGAAEQINDLVVSLRGFNLDRGTENSLTVKLQNALTGVKTGSRPAACNQLRAYLNQVQALTGKKLSVTQSNQTLIAVNRIMAALGC